MILRGWDAICSAAGGMCDDTARRLMREEGFPVSMVGGKPMSTSEAISDWVTKKCQEKSWPLGAYGGLPGPTEADS